MSGYIITTTSGELYHHGILGQKWGQKQGPPYPLSASKHSASERKAGWRKSLNSDGSVTEAGKKRYYITNKKTGDSYQTIEREKKRYRDAKKLARSESANRQEYKQAKKEIKDARKSTVADRSAKTIAKSSIRKGIIIGVSSAAFAAGAYYVGNRISKKILGTNVNDLMNAVGVGKIATTSFLSRGLRDAAVSGLGYAAYSTISKGIRSAQGYGKGDRKHKTYEEVNYGSKNKNSSNSSSKNSSSIKSDGQLKIYNTDSGVTKNVKRDYNSMDNSEFKSKYQVSKEEYAKRVEKYGDPYMNSPYAKIGKALAKKG